MAKTKGIGRVLICSVTQIEFLYSGVGRPPKYCPAVQRQRQAEQRDKAKKNAAAKRKRLKEAA